MDNNSKAFFALLKAGLWGKSVQLLPYEPLNFDALYKLADEQAVVGLVAAGLEHVSDRKITKPEAISFLKKVYSQEVRNASMNHFIGELVGKMREARIYSLIVKGQGVAQCYERPQWRSAGDIDFFLDSVNYDKARALLIPMASTVESEDRRRLHQGMTIDSWTVELHGTMHTELSRRINAGVDAVQQDIFLNSQVRVWENNGIEVFLPAPNNDAIIIFTHILEHFFIGGIGLRQICDWCRLLWAYRDQIDSNLLGQWLKDMGIMSEWRAFGSFAVSYLGIPADAMPFYKSSSCHDRKARRICRLILKTGNFGHNQDSSYRRKYPKLIEKSITFWRRLGEFSHLTTIFPLDGPRFFLTYVLRRTKAAF